MNLRSRNRMLRSLVLVVSIGVPMGLDRDFASPVPQVGGPGHAAPGRVRFAIRSSPKAEIFLDGRYIGRGSTAITIACDPIDGRFVRVVEPPSDGDGILELVQGSEKAAYVFSQKKMLQSCRARASGGREHMLFFDFRKGTLSESDRSGSGVEIHLFLGNPWELVRKAAED